MISHNGKDIRLDGENMVVVEFPWCLCNFSEISVCKIFKPGNNMKRKENESVKVFALGGVGEIGKNMYCVEIDSEIFIAGLMFPEMKCLELISLFLILHI